MRPPLSTGSNGGGKGLLVAANRLPVAMVRDAQGTLQLTRGSGGLVTALLPVVRDRGGTWVGWPGLCVDAELDRLLGRASRRSGFRLVPISLTDDERRGFYAGFSTRSSGRSSTISRGIVGSTPRSGTSTATSTANTRRHSPRKAARVTWYGSMTTS